MNIETFTSAILSKMSDIGKWQRSFLLDVIRLYLSIRPRLHYLNLGRYGKGNELSYRRNFSKAFDFTAFNSELIQSVGSKNLAIVYDPCYIQKSGKHTPGVGHFWSGCARAAKWGLEIGGFAVADLDNHTAFHYGCQQTMTSEAPSGGVRKGESEKAASLLDTYVGQIKKWSKGLLELSKVLVVDAYFSKKPFVDGVIEAGFEVVTRLRKDAYLRYAYLGPRKAGRGRPKTIDGKIDLKNLSPRHFKMFRQDEDGTQYYEGLAHVRSLKRWCKMVVMHTFKDGKLTAAYAYISNNTKMTGDELWNYYHIRFQIEFLYRDAKQHLGLEHSQSRNREAMNFHFNLSLTILNIVKAVHWLNIPKQKRPAFSMADFKTQYVNELMVDKFIKTFGIDPNLKENKAKIQKLYDFGKIAA